MIVNISFTNGTGIYIAAFFFFEQELSDDVFDIVERKRKHTLAQKRSFFVRMVSDPKIYNPTIAKTPARRHLTDTVGTPYQESNVSVQPPP